MTKAHTVYEISVVGTAWSELKLEVWRKHVL